MDSKEIREYSNSEEEEEEDDNIYCTLSPQSGPPDPFPWVEGCHRKYNRLKFILNRSDTQWLFLQSRISVDLGSLTRRAARVRFSFEISFLLNDVG